MSFAEQVISQLLPGLAVTVELSLIASAFALILGLLIAVVRYFRVPVLDPVVRLIVNFLRGTPLLVQLYFIFYVFPTFGLTLDADIVGILGLGLYFSAYTSETYRGSILAVPSSQWEAARALSLPAARTWRRIILPQAIRLVIPPLGNTVVVMFKESALLSAITVNELMARANGIADTTARYFVPLSLVALLYFAVSYPAALGIRRVEASLAKR